MIFTLYIIIIPRIGRAILFSTCDSITRSVSFRKLRSYDLFLKTQFSPPDDILFFFICPMHFFKRIILLFSTFFFFFTCEFFLHMIRLFSNVHFFHMQDVRFYFFMCDLITRSRICLVFFKNNLCFSLYSRAVNPPSNPYSTCDPILFT